jgi:hypothetical protein
MHIDFAKVEMTQATYDKKNTITKFVVTLENEGEQPIFVDGKFRFTYISLKNQAKRPGPDENLYEYSLKVLSEVPAEEFSFADIGNAFDQFWTTVDGVSENFGPLKKKKYIVGIKLPTNSYISAISLMDSRNVTESYIDYLNLGFCPSINGSSITGIPREPNEECRSGKLEIIDRG